jgi:hypothetical protein
VPDYPEAIHFETNVPVALQLKFNDGRLFNGKYGDRVRYTVESTHGERTMFVPPEVSEKLRAAGIGAFMPFQIGKMETRRGNRRHIEWKVRLLQPEEATPVFGGGKTEEPPPQQEPNMPSHTNRTNGTPRPATPIPFVAREDTSDLLGALNSMIDICAAATEYARAKGMQITFTGEDIRALAITTYIQHRRSGGAR